MKYFAAFRFDPNDKVIVITGPDDIQIEVDYDDVDHPVVRKIVKKAIRILNANWEK